MRTSRIAIGIGVILSFVLFGLPAFSDEPAIGDSETIYTCVINKEIAKCQSKIELKNSKSPNLKKEAVKASMKSAFLEGYKKELVAEMKRENIGTNDYQISHFLNERFVEVVTPVLASEQRPAGLMRAAGN